MKNITAFFAKKTVLYVITALVIVGGAVIYFRSGSGKEETLVVHAGDFLQQVSISGKVTSDEKLDLSFEQTGLVNTVKVKVGDIVTPHELLASQNTSDLYAQLAQMQAGVDVAQAKLAQTLEGASPENVGVGQASLLNAKQSLDDAARDAYVKSEDAVRNKVDALFNNPNSVVPMIVLQTDSNNTQNDINARRSLINEKLNAWKLISSSSATPENFQTISDNLAYIKSFMDTLNYIVTKLSSADGGLTKAQIDNYISIVNAASAEVNTASTNFSAASNGVRLAQANLTLTQAPPQNSDIELAQAGVRQAQAQAQNIVAQIGKKEIRSPIDGVVTVVNSKVGSSVGQSDIAISLISADTLQIESYVPEKNIPFIKIGDEAAVTLDAYGTDAPFTAKVVSIDPAETIKDGVSTYRVLLQFTQKDDRVRSGMTANVLVTTEKKSNVIAVPQGIVADKNGQKSVIVKEAGKNVERKVETGSVSSLGQIEITSGLSDGDVVVLIDANK